LFQISHKLPTVPCSNLIWREGKTMGRKRKAKGICVLL
jgi:hypothetical protein